MYKIIKNKKLIKAILISLSQILISFYYDKIIFNSTALDSIVWIYWCKFILFFLLILFWFNIFQSKKRYYRFVLIYFMIMFVVFLIVYPGIWRWDDIINISSISNGYMYHWQHFLSSVYYYMCLCVIPIPAGVVLIQILIISHIVGHIIGVFFDKFGNKAYFFYIIFILPSVIDSNFYPMRANICAYLELYVLFRMLFFCDQTDKIDNKKLLLLTLLISLLSVWRPENIIYILLFILFLIIYKVDTKKIFAFVMISFIFIFGVLKIQNDGLSKVKQISSYGTELSEKELYSLSGFITPFSNLIISSEDDDIIKEVNEIIDVESIKTKGGLAVFWDKNIKKLSSKDLKKLEKNYLLLIINHFPTFFAERINVFFASNGLIEGTEMMLKGSSFLYDNNSSLIPEDVVGVYNDFKNNYKYNRPINANARRIFINVIEMKDGKSFNTGEKNLLMIFYNCTFSVLLSCFIIIHSFIRKNKAIFLILVFIAIKFSIIIATAPMPAYMYYFSTHIICSTMVLYYFMINKKLKKEGANVYKDITLIFDVDGTICPIKKQEDSYSDLIPDEEMINKIRDYRKNGAKIVFYSSRNMKTYNGNLGLINANTAIIMQEWLKRWDIPYDEIYFGKPWPGHHGLYIDDRAVRPDEFLKYDFNELENICEKSSRVYKENKRKKKHNINGREKWK